MGVTKWLCIILLHFISGFIVEEVANTEIPYNMLGIFI